MIARERHNARNMAVLRFDFCYFALAHREMLLRKERALHALLVFALVGLGAQRVHGRALGTVEHAALQRGIVNRQAHFAAESVHLAHQMPLARAADGGIAGHQRDGVQIEREKQRFHAHARAGERGFAAGMARADDNDIVSH